MRTVRSLGPLALTPALVLAILAGALLPPEHMHLPGIEGRTHSIVHRHSVEDFGPGQGGPSIATHGDHERALFLSTFCDGVSRFVTHPPAVAHTANFILHSLDPLESVQADDAHRAHGPPGSTCPTRAPPSLG